MAYAWKITRDHLYDDETDLPSREGWGRNLSTLKTAKTNAFRIYDDDGILYYSGILIDDDDCESQTDALEWACWDAGATTIKVRRGNRWVQDIG
jgi:hypothetical protein